LAALAGVSSDYLTRLEQGRHHDPSPEVLAALATALGLNAQGRRHLFMLGGRPDPGPRIAGVRHVPRPLALLVDRASPSPAWILNRRRDILVWNAGAEALWGGLAGRPESQRNQLWLTFLDPDTRALWADWPLVAQDTVAQLRHSVTGVPAALDDLLDALRDDREFLSLWERHDVARACNPVRLVRHPVAGDVVFEVELLDAADGDLQLVVLDPSDSEGAHRWTAFMARSSGGLRVVDA
jgi:transcriptional regulator with XRE-family HTH domain